MPSGNTKPPIKLLIAGGRDFTDAKLMWDYIQQMLDQKIIGEDCALVCGNARGADSIGHYLFSACGNEIHNFPADWKKHGLSAGYRRNAEMGNFCDMALIFWDGKSKGTKHMIDYMEKLGKPYHVVSY